MIKQLTLLADYHTKYIKKTLKSPPGNLLELINEFGKVSGYKTNILKLVTFLYTNNDLSEREIF